jgi:hypothetical protein
MLQATVKKFFRPKSWLAVAPVLLVFLAVPLLAAQAAIDPVSNIMLQIFGWIISFFVSILAIILTVVIGALVEIAQYNGFITAPPVVQGWVIVRDLCNMFFVLILLIIAFATILRIPNYSVKQLLKRVIIFAILINFSKMIAGLLIDFAQVIMLTFVNGFKDIGGANMSFLMGLDKLVAMGGSAGNIQTNDTGASFWGVVGSYTLALLYVIVMLVVTIALLVTLIFRIIMLWIYIILSPAAYLGAVAPLTKGIFTTWWRQFSQNLFTGPILAFFIWLSLATLGQFNDSNTFLRENGFRVPDAASGPTVGVTEIGTVAHMMRLGISMSLLIGGLMVAKSFGGVAGGAVSGVVSRAQRGAGWIKKRSVGLAKRGVVAAGRRPAYAIADRGLGAFKAMPLVGAAATRQQARLRMKREHAEDKDTKYMRYVDGADLDRMMRSGGIWSEKKRIDQKRAQAEKVRRAGNADWGRNTVPAGSPPGTVSQAARNKTQAAIDIFNVAGGRLNERGELVFRDEEHGKRGEDLLKANPGHINQDALRNYYANLNAQGLQQYGTNFEDNPLGRPGSNIIEHFARRMSKKDLLDLHHSQLTDEVLNSIAFDRHGTFRASKKLAGVYDNGKETQRQRLEDWATNIAGANGVNTIFGDRQHNFGAIGRPFIIKGQTNNPVVASGVGGLDKINKGRFSVDFAELNLPANQSGLYVSDPAQKAEVVNRLSNKLRAGGMSEDQVAATANQLNSLSYLMLRNKGMGVSLSDSKATHAHEWLHAAVDQNFSQAEKEAVWNSLDEGARNDNRQKIKATWGGGDLPEEAVIDEYLAESLRNKTRWNKGADVSLNGRAEATMNQILAGKGTSVNQLVSNVTSTRPVVGPNATKSEIRETITNDLGGSVSGADPELSSAIKNLAKTVGDIGNGLDMFGQVAKSFDSLSFAVNKNSTNLLNQAKAFKDNSSELERFSKEVKRAA